jgi:hypothetical protein
MSEKKLSYAEICVEMEKLSRKSRVDSEKAHIEADKLVIEALKLIGSNRLVKAYEKVDKWDS